MGRKPDLDTYDERAFLVNLNHSKLFAIPRHDHIETHKDLVVEECALEMLLASARANAYKCTNILGVKPGLISHQIVGRNGMWPSLEDQIHHSKKEYDLFSCYTFLKICRTSIEAAITILSEALVKYEEDPEILWSLLNHQSVSYSTNGKEALDFLVDYADVPLAKRAVEEYEERSSEMFDEVAVMEAQNNARVNFHKRVATATGTEPEPSCSAKCPCQEGFVVMRQDKDWASKIIDLFRKPEASCDKCQKNKKLEDPKSFWIILKSAVKCTE